MYSIKEIFNQRVNNSELNTSYPINKSSWVEYRVNKELLFEKDEELSFYIHIPFCESLCSFCEYTKMKIPAKSKQEHYITVLESDIDRFIKNHSNIILKGFDIGGGTPTALDDVYFQRLIDIYIRIIQTVKVSSNFEPSIEATFDSLTKEKLKIISKAGIKRISLGMQSTSKTVLFTNNRTGKTKKDIKEWMLYAKSVGIEKINIDFMYGLVGQNIEDIKYDLNIILYLKPEQVTIYELRTNMLHYNNQMSKEELYESYNTIYEGLINIGYKSHFGQNTFSLNKYDFGVSSYLYQRMFNGLSYKGFGISAQSMSKHGVSYNVGKNKKKLSDIINLQTYDEEYSYKLPNNELLSKYIAISAYSGRFSVKIASKKLNDNFLSYFKDEIDFLIKQDLMYFKDKNLCITQKGFKNYGAVFSLFYKNNKSVIY